MMPLNGGVAAQMCVQAFGGVLGLPDDPDQRACVDPYLKGSIGDLTGITNDSFYELLGIALVAFSGADFAALESRWDEVWSYIMAMLQAWWHTTNPGQPFPKARFPQPKIAEDARLGQLIGKLEMDWGQ